MKLGATITSERGKAVTKTGNDYITVQITNSANEIVCTLHINDGGTDKEWNNGCTVVTANYERYRTIVRRIPWENIKNNGNLKHGNTLDTIEPTDDRDFMD